MLFNINLLVLASVEVIFLHDRVGVDGIYKGFDRHPTFLADTLWYIPGQEHKPDVIRIDGLILCERPLEFGQMEKEALEAQNAEALKSVKWAADNIEVKDRKTFINKTSHEAGVF